MVQKVVFCVMTNAINLFLSCYDDGCFCFTFFIFADIFTKVQRFVDMAKLFFAFLVM